MQVYFFPKRATPLPFDLQSWWGTRKIWVPTKLSPLQNRCTYDRHSQPVEALGWEPHNLEVIREGSGKAAI